MKNQKIIFTEYEFTAHDVDNGDTLDDVVGINREIQTTDGAIEQSIERMMDKHPVISLSGNTWQLDDFGPTGRVYTKEIIYTEVSPRHVEKEYPAMNMG